MIKAIWFDWPGTRSHSRLPASGLITLDATTLQPFKRAFDLVFVNKADNQINHKNVDAESKAYRYILTNY